MKKIATFEIDYIQYLDENSEPTQAFPTYIDNDLLLKLYRDMTLTRTLDKKAINLQRTGKLGTYPASTGQEATAVGIGHTMTKDDILCTYYRDQGTAIMRGVKMSEVLSYWGGDERATAYANNNTDFPPCVPIATQSLHATGVAYALQYQNKKNAVVTTIGEGGTSKGDFYEALNVAGCWNLPVVFVAINNQWAISVPREKQTRCETIAQKAIAGGFEGIQVDGNDIVAVVVAMKYALEKAYAGKGPTLIEAVVYRLADHTTADDASRYRPDAEVQQAWQEEPIRRLGIYLEKQGVWSKDQESALQKECSDAVEEAVTEYLNPTAAPATDIIDYMYAELPEPLLEQRDQIEEYSQ